MKNRKRQRTRDEPWVGPWLRGRRKEKQLDVEDVARRLKRSHSAVSRIETGNSAIAADDLPMVLRAYLTTIDEFAEAAKAA